MARRRAQALQGRFFGGLGMSPLAKFAVDLAAFLFIAAVTVVIFGIGFTAYFAFRGS